MLFFFGMLFSQIESPTDESRRRFQDQPTYRSVAM